MIPWVPARMLFLIYINLEGSIFIWTERSISLNHKRQAIASIGIKIIFVKLLIIPIVLKIIISFEHNVHIFKALKWYETFSKMNYSSLSSCLIIYFITNYLWKIYMIITGRSPIYHYHHRYLRQHFFKKLQNLENDPLDGIYIPEASVQQSKIIAFITAEEGSLYEGGLL